MQKGEVETAERRALNWFDKWNNTTGFVVPHTSYYYEMQGIVKDAVHFGIQQVTGDFKPMDGE